MYRDRDRVLRRTVTVKVLGHSMIRMRPWQGGPRTPTASGPTGFGQDDLDPLSRLDRRRGWPVPPRGFLASLLGESGSK